MRNFKFFDGGWQQPPLEPIVSAGLENEMVIRYTNHANFCVYRTIAWVRGIHAFADNWIQREFEGTMDEFFSHWLEIPVILSIEALIPNGATFTEDDREYLNYFNFECPVKIIYYQYEPI
jgi:hypothetical protein